MKTSRILAALVTLSASAAIAGIKLETRTDYKNHTFNEDAGQKGYSTTQLTRASLGISHKVSEELSVSTRLDLLKTTASTSPDKSGTTSDMIEYAYASYSPIKDFTITMGRLSAIGGGFENQYNAGDVYMYSSLSGAIVQNNLGGVGATYMMGDHQFDLQMTNDDAAQTASTNSMPASRNLMGVQYLGNFMDKKLQVIASYHTMKYHNGTYEDKPITTTVVGVAYDLGMAKFDLDYGMKIDEANGSVNGKDQHTGFVFNAAVPVMEKHKVIAKFESSETKANGTKQYTYTNMGVAWECALSDMSNFHVAYNSLSRKDALSAPVADLKYEEKQLMVGFKVYADIMK